MFTRGRLIAPLLGQAAPLEQRAGLGERPQHGTRQGDSRRERGVGLRPLSVLTEHHAAHPQRIYLGRSIVFRRSSVQGMDNQLSRPLRFADRQVRLCQDGHWIKRALKHAHSEIEERLEASDRRLRPAVQLFALRQELMGQGDALGIATLLADRQCLCDIPLTTGVIALVERQPAKEDARNVCIPGDPQRPRHGE